MNRRLATVLQDTVETLVAKARPEKIVLFGSHANGAPGPDSDIDLLIIWNGGAGMRHVDRCIRLRKFLLDIHPGPIDVLTYTESELADILAEPRRFTSQIYNQGKVIYERSAGELS